MVLAEASVTDHEGNKITYTARQVVLMTHDRYYPDDDRLVRHYLLTPTRGFCVCRHPGKWRRLKDLVIPENRPRQYVLPYLWWRHWEEVPKGPTLPGVKRREKMTKEHIVESDGQYYCGRVSESAYPADEAERLLAERLLYDYEYLFCKTCTLRWRKERGEL